MENFLSVNNLSIDFGGIRALNQVNFDVKQDEIFSIVGPNGAGKTTLFNCINNIYKPTNGNIFFLGEEISKLSTHKIAKRGIARAFQNVELFTNMTVLDNIILGYHVHQKLGLFSSLKFWGRGKRDEIGARENAEEVLDLLNIQAYRNVLISELPFGAMKLVEIGRALALRPKVLLLDEPVGGMNIEEREDLGRYILDIRRRLNVTILLVEHDMRFVMDLSDRILVLHFGEKIALGKPDEIRNDEKVIQSYLGQSE